MAIYSILSHVNASTGADGKWVAVDKDGNKVSLPKSTKEEALQEGQKRLAESQGPGQAAPPVTAKQILNG